jgi:hypothetical protein
MNLYDASVHTLLIPNLLEQGSHGIPPGSSPHAGRSEETITIQPDLVSLIAPTKTAEGDNPPLPGFPCT